MWDTRIRESDCLSIAATISPIVSTCLAFDPREPESVEIFFSAHGVPKSYVTDAGDPYKEEMEDCVQLIMGELRCDRMEDDPLPRLFVREYSSPLLSPS